MSKNTAVRVSILTIFLSASIFSCVLYAKSALFPICGAAVFILLNIFPSFIKRPSKKLRISSDGADLLTSFLALVCIECIAFPICASLVIGWFTAPFLTDLAIIVVADLILFWNGIIRVYLTSDIIGVKWRVAGILCGLIPIAHLFVLIKIIGLVRFDVGAEEERKKRNDERKERSVCQTKYPLLLVHGVFFRDTRYLNYWGRIPKELEKNGDRKSVV